MKNKLTATVLCNLFLVALLVGAGLAQAQTQNLSITFPIADLGNCDSKDECKQYCNDPVHQDACFSFAETHGLMSKNEIKEARKFSGMKGPGGCTGSDCKTYCDEGSHMNECIQFAKDHNLIPEKELKIIQDIEQNGGPGGCKSKEECMTYCGNGTHQAECQSFARAHGFTQEEPQGENNQQNNQQGDENSQPDISQIDKVLEAGGGPGGCTNGDTCRQYCDDVSHHDECFKFGKEHGLISQDDAQMTERVEQDIKTSGGPGGCTDTNSCKSFCSDPTNVEACHKFANERKLLPPKDMQNEKSRNMQEQNQMQGAEGQKPPCISAEDCKSKIESGHMMLPPGMTKEQAQQEMQKRQDGMKNQNQNGSDINRPSVNSDMNKPTQGDMRPYMNPDQQKQHEYDNSKSRQGENVYPSQQQMMQDTRPMMQQIPPQGNMQPPAGMPSPSSAPSGNMPPPHSSNLGASVIMGILHIILGF